jgi:hypothetical protein
MMISFRAIKAYDVYFCLSPIAGRPGRSRPTWVAVEQGKEQPPDHAVACLGTFTAQTKPEATLLAKVAQDVKRGANFRPFGEMEPRS